MKPGLTRALATIALIGAAGTGLRAELKYTIHFESHKAAVPAPPDPMLAMMGAMLMETMAPGGSLDLTCIVGEKGLRIEWRKAIKGVPAGAALIRRPDGTTVVINPADKTYWKLTVFSLLSLPARMGPKITATPTADVATVAGVRARRATLQIVVPFLQAQAGETVSGTPTELPIAGEVWITDQYKKYVTPASGVAIGLLTLGMNTAPDGGFAVRQVLRGPMFGELELESTITAVTEEDVPASLFEIPAGFKEIPPPSIDG